MRFPYHAAQRTGKGAGLADLLDRAGQRFSARRQNPDNPV